jgi:hypothetical protein
LTIEDRYKADLHKNEYIRTSNGFYSYKYVDIYGERKVITSKSLEGLRKKEKVIEDEKEFRNRAMRQDLTISEILELYYNSRKEHPNTQGKSNNTLKANENVIKIINGYKFSQYKVFSVQLKYQLLQSHFPKVAQGNSTKLQSPCLVFLQGHNDL